MIITWFEKDEKHSIPLAIKNTNFKLKSISWVGNMKIFIIFQTMIHFSYFVDFFFEILHSSGYSKYKFSTQKYFAGQKYENFHSFWNDY